MRVRSGLQHLGESIPEQYGSAVLRLFFSSVASLVILTTTCDAESAFFPDNVRADTT